MERISSCRRIHSRRRCHLAANRSDGRRRHCLRAPAVAATTFMLTCFYGLSVLTSAQKLYSSTSFHGPERRHDKAWNNNTNQKGEIIERRRKLQSTCSCAPRSFTVSLDLLNDCLDDTFEAKEGISNTACTIEAGDPVFFADELSGSLQGILADLMGVKEFEDMTESNGSDGLEIIDVVDDTNNETMEEEKREEEPSGEILDSSSEGDDNDKETQSQTETADPATSSPSQQGTTKREQNKNKNKTTGKRDETKRPKRKNNKNSRHLQGGGRTTPTRITSVTLIEINSLNDVINVDDQFTNVDFNTGTSFELQSISASLSPNVDIEDQLGLVPSTQVLFYIGENDQMEEVRGRFVWRYTNSCDENAVTIQQGDVFGWSDFVEVEDQLGVFCPANGGGGGTPRPTRQQTPRPTPLPTDPPVFIDTEVPTFTPTELPTQIGIGNTPAPTKLPVDSSTVLPTFFPTQVPTLSPVDSPTPPEPTTEGPTDTGGGIAPTRSPNDFIMSMSMTYSSSYTAKSYHSIDNFIKHFGSGGSSSSHSQSSRSGSGSKSHKTGKSGKSHKSSKMRMKSRNKSGKSGSGSSGSSKSGKGGSKSTSSDSSSRSKWWRSSSSGSSSSKSSKSGKKR